MKRFVLHNISLFVFCSLMSLYADEIVLRNGTSAETEILDTAGCVVKIIRRNKEVKIKKSFIDRIVMSADTISYADFKCEVQTAPKAVRFSETPEYRLMGYVDNFKEVEAPFVDPGTVIYLRKPLEGNYDIDEFIAVQKGLLTVLEAKATAKAASPEEMLEQFSFSDPVFRYALLAREYTIEQYSKPKASVLTKVALRGIDGLSNKLSTYPEKKDLNTRADFVLIDLYVGMVILRLKTYQKRTVADTDKKSLFPAFTPIELEEKWAQQREDKALNKNAISIKKKLEKLMAAYLDFEGIKKVD